MADLEHLWRSIHSKEACLDLGLAIVESKADICRQGLVGDYYRKNVHRQ